MLKALPAERYVHAERRLGVPSSTTMLEIERYDYSVPYWFAREAVEAPSTSRTVAPFQQGDRYGTSLSATTSLHSTRTLPLKA